MIGKVHVTDSVWGVQAMLRRIMHSRSVFDSKKWVEERQEMEKRIKVGGLPCTWCSSSN